jgi:sensor histidine kinase YesM
MTSRRSAWIFAASFWALFGLISGIQVWISMITHGHSVPRLLSYHLLIWQGWLLPTMVTVWLARRFPLIPARRTSVLVHILAGSVFGVLHSFWWLGLMVTIRPYDRMTAEIGEIHMSRILFARLPLEWILYCLVLGAAIAYDYYERFREKSVRTAQLEASLTAARLHALELQLQPHFLFNTLNAVTTLVRSRRNDDAAAMLVGLSDLLRYTLDHAGHQRVALEEELTVLRRYLDIQQMRFGDRMSFTFDVAPDATRAAMPALMLQPLAENAVRHGIEQLPDGGVVNVSASRDGDRLRIDIFNSGKLASASSNGIGLRNTRERLQHLYGDDATFSLVNAAGGVLASLTIPWSEMT